MTERLFYKDAYIKEFESEVKSCEKTEEGYLVTLSQTAFYPEGGGQPGDRGTLYIEDEKIQVLDTQEKGEEILHFCDRPVEIGKIVRGSIDWNRRFTHMQEHSGEHIISGIICKAHNCNNIGFHMGKDCVTIDFDVVLSWEDIEAAEKTANAVIMQNAEILEEYPSAEVLKELSYRSKKELEGAVRIVTIPGADICACCGTHVKHTGEIGLLKVTACEHFKNGVRLTLLIGKKALEDYAHKQENIKKISTLLSVKPENTAEAVDKLKEQANAFKMELIALKMQLLDMKVDKIPEGSKKAVLFEEGLTTMDVRKLADKLQSKAVFAAVFNGSDESGYQYVVCSQTMDIAAFGKEFNKALNGRGGGKNPMIQGSVAAKKADIEEFLTTI